MLDASRLPQVDDQFFQGGTDVLGALGEKAAAWYGCMRNGIWRKGPCMRNMKPLDWTGRRRTARRSRNCRNSKFERREKSTDRKLLY